MRPPNRLEMWFATAVYGWTRLVGAVRSARYRLGLGGCPGCTMRRGHKMDCGRVR